MPRTFTPPAPAALKPFATLATLAAFLAFAPRAAAAEPILHCTLVQESATQHIEVAPAPRPYGFEAHDIRGLFRFKAVVVGEAGRIAYVKLYTYYLKRGRPYLMHVEKFLEPALPRAGESVPLTGTAQLYSPVLGRELEYSCRLGGGRP